MIKHTLLDFPDIPKNSTGGSLNNSAVYPLQIAAGYIAQLGVLEKIPSVHDDFHANVSHKEWTVELKILNCHKEINNW